MPRFFVKISEIISSSAPCLIYIKGEDALHITRVLRMKSGEELIVCDENGREYKTRIRETGEVVTLDVVSYGDSENEPPYKATVYQALVKGDRFDTVLQKATELGASDIVPMISSRCIVSIDARDSAKKLERWRRIVYEASKQCGRAAIPTVHAPMLFEEAIRSASSADLPVFCYEGEGTSPLTEHVGCVPSPKTVSVVIGPEGGFSVSEAEYARSLGVKMTGLGKRILRTETAAPFVLSCISFAYELDR